MTGKLFNRLPLPFCQILERILNILEIGHIRENLLGICQIFVHIIEITKQNISPEDEIIQRLCLRIMPDITIVKGQEKRNPIRNLHRCGLTEEVTHRKQLRHNKRPTGHSLNSFRQIFLEEHHRTAVREDETSVFNSPNPIIVLSNLFQKRFHIISFLFSTDKGSIRFCQIIAQHENNE